MIPDAIQKLADALAELPGIGPRQALRIAFRLASNGKRALEQLMTAGANMRALTLCTQCFLPHDSGDDLCRICNDKSRSADLVAIIEKETDLIALEASKQFRGRYLVLGPLKRDGALTTDHRTRLTALKNQFKSAPATEIIIALSPTTYGDVNSASISAELKGVAKKITRLGRGLPSGGEVEFADEETLGGALTNRN